ncbi:MAG: D-glycero-beta-D-manno-heptose-7-phosphate kinase, partial [Betaproteobacteria bacterium]|nr:D-glycero-beta-D-manno-heptose-7-phosphate kinase [Betaproteobacteria bacterium]
MNRDALRRARVLVVGDVMLDRYWFGDVHRISPEAPVPVVHVQRVEERLGGAANVALNAASLGAQTTLLTVHGDDDAGRALARLFEQSAFAVRKRVDGALSTTVKLRVLARQQQLIRIDFENTPDHELLLDLQGEYEAIVAAQHAVVLSDYGKGGLTHVRAMIEHARAAGVPVLVDPKGSDWQKYQGATLLTPNRSEFAAFAGAWSSEAQLHDKAQRCREQLSLEALLVTRSEEGMTLFTATGTHHVAAQAREVYDVSGAGDTVIAVLAALRAAGASLPQAVDAA